MPATEPDRKSPPPAAHLCRRTGLIGAADLIHRRRPAGVQLCCLSDILTDGLGHGCADDIDAILQTACYGELIIAKRATKRAERQRTKAAVIFIDEQIR